MENEERNYFEYKQIKCKSATGKNKKLDVLLEIDKSNLKKPKINVHCPRLIDSYKCYILNNLIERSEWEGKNVRTGIGPMMRCPYAKE